MGELESQIFLSISINKYQIEGVKSNQKGYICSVKIKPILTNKSFYIWDFSWTEVSPGPADRQGGGGYPQGIISGGAYAKP
jgi:hypothetical protein